MTDWPYQLELTRPWLLGVLVVLPILLYYFYWSLVDFARWQQMASLACRIAVIVLLALALAGLTLMSPTTRQFVMFVVDKSLSVDEEAKKKADAYLKKAAQAAKENKVSFLAFAQDPAQPTDQWPVDDVQSEKDGNPDAKSSDEEQNEQKGTNIAAAIGVAAASIPPFYVPQIVVLSDGNETTGDAVQAALASGIPVSTAPLPTRDEPETQVSAVNVPAQVRQGEPFYVEVIIDSNRESEGRIEIFKGPHKMDTGAETQKIKKGENRFRFRQTVESERLVEFAARISGFDDTLLDNNTASGLVYMTGKPRVLLIDSDPRTAKQLAWSLEEQDIVADVRPPQGVPESLAGLQNYEAVLLSNVPATDLTMRQMEAMRTYVQDLGGGLIMLGGDKSFGLGGYYKTTLEEILPVRSDFEKEKEKPSLAMVLVIDKSGSMGGMKMELAKDASKGAVELLGPRDQIGVVAFDGASYWVSELHSAADQGYITGRISTIQASGGTSIYPGMLDAYEALSSAVAKLKHVILLTDGHSSPGDFEGLASQMAAARITVSTVAVGSGADSQLLETISRIGGGRHYECDDPQTVPQIFAKETVTASKSAINEQPFLPQLIRPTQALADLDLESAPFLLGFVVTRPKPTSEFILATESGEPLLVWWRYGLGMSAAFTSDAKSRWAAEWLSWPDFGKFWAQVIRHVMRKSEAKNVFVEVEQRGGRSHVVLDAIDPAGRFLNNAATKLTVIDPQLGSEKIDMRQTAPGRYVSSFPIPSQGTYHIELSQQAGGVTSFRQSRGLVVGYSDELRLRPTNEQLLRQIAQVSGGRYNPNAEEIFDVGERMARQAIPLWPYLLMIAAGLFLADVALRRLDFSRPGRQLSR